MNTLVCCGFCGVWVVESESRAMNDFDGFTVNLFAGDAWCCRDEHACVRRKKDKVAGPSLGTTNGCEMSLV